MNCASQQNRLQQLQKYLPTLQLKKAMLQVGGMEARIEIAKCEEEYPGLMRKWMGYAVLLCEKTFDRHRDSAKIKQVTSAMKISPGLKFLILKSIVFEDFSYSLFDTPAWVDGAPRV